MFGLFSILGSLISGAVSVIGSALGSLGSFAINLLNIAGPFIGPVLNIVSSVAKILGLLNGEDNIEEIGAKALQEDSLQEEDFTSEIEYLNYLRNFELDKKTFEEASETEKLARKGVGTAITMKAINEKKGFEIPVETWVAMAKVGFNKDNSKEINKIIDTFHQKDNLKDFSQYVDGKIESINKIEKVTGLLITIYKELEPQTPIEEIEKKVMNMEVGDIKIKEIKN